MSEDWLESMERLKQERIDYEVLRGQRANTFLEVSRQHSCNTSGEVRDLGWYLWKSFYVDSRYKHRHRYSSYYYSWRASLKEIGEREREQFEKRFQEAVEEWGKGRKSRRFGVNFLAFVCGVHKGTVSKKLDDWAWHYRNATGNRTPEEVAMSHTFDLLFVDTEEYHRLAEESDDILDFGAKAEKRAQEIREEKRRFRALLERVSRNVIIPKERGGVTHAR